MKAVSPRSRRHRSASVRQRVAAAAARPGTANPKSRLSARPTRGRPERDGGRVGGREDLGLRGRARRRRLRGRGGRRVDRLGRLRARRRLRRRTSRGRQTVVPRWTRRGRAPPLDTSRTSRGAAAIPSRRSQPRRRRDPHHPSTATPDRSAAAAQAFAKRVVAAAARPGTAAAAPPRSPPVDRSRGAAITIRRSAAPPPRSHPSIATAAPPQSRPVDRSRGAAANAPPPDEARRGAAERVAAPPKSRYTAGRATAPPEEPRHRRTSPTTAAIPTPRPSKPAPPPRHGGRRRRRRRRDRGLLARREHLLDLARDGLDLRRTRSAPTRGDAAAQVVGESVLATLRPDRRRGVRTSWCLRIAGESVHAPSSRPGRGDAAAVMRIAGESVRASSPRSNVAAIAAESASPRLDRGHAASAGHRRKRALAVARIGDEAFARRGVCGLTCARRHGHGSETRRPPATDRRRGVSASSRPRASGEAFALRIATTPRPRIGDEACARRHFYGSSAKRPRAVASARSQRRPRPRIGDEASPRPRIAGEAFAVASARSSTGRRPRIANKSVRASSPRPDRGDAAAADRRRNFGDEASEDRPRTSSSRKDESRAAARHGLDGRDGGLGRGLRRRVLLVDLSGSRCGHARSSGTAAAMLRVSITPPARTHSRISGTTASRAETAKALGRLGSSPRHMPRCHALHCRCMRRTPK